MAGESGIKNRRGELQRVLSQEESYVDGKLSHAAFISIAILTFITFVGNFTQLQLSSALPIIVSEFHISVTTGQWLTSVFQLVMGVMVPLTAFLTRRFSTRQIVICSMAVFTLGSVLAWLGPNFVWVLVGRVLEAGGTGVMWPTKVMKVRIAIEINAAWLSLPSTYDSSWLSTRCSSPRQFLILLSPATHTLHFRCSA